MTFETKPASEKLAQRKVVMGHGLVTERDFQIGLEPAWHKLTKVVEKISRGCFPEVVPQPLYFGDDFAPMTYGSKPYVVPISLDDKLPVSPPYCTDSYCLFTPRDAWDYVHEVLGGTRFTVKSIGMIWNRSQWFMSTWLDELAGILDGYEFNLNWSGGLDRSISPQSELSGTRIVCSNTQLISRMTGEVLFKKKATKKFRTALEESKAEIEKAVGMSRIFAEQLKSLEANSCTPERAGRIYAGYIGLDTNCQELSTRGRNTVEQLKALHVRGLGNRGETEADCLNGFTEYYTRGNTESPNYDAGKAWVSGEFGGNADRKAAFAGLMMNRVVHTDREWSLGEVEKLGEKMLLAV